MKSYEFRGIMTALSSIAHSGGMSFGINTKLRREKFVQPDGSIEDVPVLSGNGLRGLLRDVGMLHMCKKIGYGVNNDDGEILGLSLQAFYFLFSGGALTSDGSGAIDIKTARELREMIPLVGLFGGAVGNQIMPGKLKIGKAIPICSETVHLLPDNCVNGGVVNSIWDYLQEEMYTRKDDEKDEHKRHLIESTPLKQLEQGKIDLDEAEKKIFTPDAPKQQMMYYVETLSPGTRFYWDIILDDVTDVEFEAFITTLLEFSKRPFVGGKSNVGMGKVKINFDKWLTIEPHTVSKDSKKVSFQIGTLYEKHLSKNGKRIREKLASF